MVINVINLISRPFYRHWDTWCVHYLWHPVMPFEWSRVRNLSSLSTNIISNLTNNVKFFFVFSFFSFVLLKEFPLWTSGLIPISFLIFHNDSLFLVPHLSYTYSIPQVKGQCQVFSDVFLSVSFPSLSIWRINDGLIQGPQGESRRAPNGQFGRITLISLGVRHISCRVCSSISCHHLLCQTVHRVVQFSMTILVECLP